MLTAIGCRWRYVAAVVLLLAGASVAQPPNTLHAQAGMALLLEIRDAIGPATSDFFVRTLEQTRERQAPLVIGRMDTPGGLDSSMRDMNSGGPSIAQIPTTGGSFA